MMRVGALLPAFLLALAVASPALSQDAKPPAGKEAEKAADLPEPRTWKVERSGTFAGTKIDYSVVAHETRLKNDKGEPVADMFSIAYLRQGVKDPSRRPVTFLFNGGPGSASLWLHMGVFGPRRIDVPSDGGNAGAPPYPIVDNAQTILDVTDLVFIDPVGTGYSRVVGKGEEKDFLGVSEDARSVAKFIRQWLSDNKRWNSPKFLGGESYGAVRTAAVAKELSKGDSWVSLNGLLLISGAVDFATLDFGRGNDEAYWTFLPSYAATAWYHGKVPNKGNFEAFIEEARRFALERYAPALLKGNRLTPAERAAIVKDLARFTGLSETYIDRANLRVSAARFQKELLRDQGKTIGRFDGRYTGEDFDDAGETFDNDPSYYGVAGAYTAAINDYMERDLGVDMDREYKVLGSMWNKWNWSVGENSSRNGYIDVTPWIGQAMRENKDLRTLSASGYYDLATPFFAKENTLNNNGVPTERVTFTYYQGGHMMYVNKPALDKLVDDVRKFIQAGLKQE
ncbi:S10 family peptidase [Rhodocista pekingensis]|uniref:S10 family peptidase n=1 Tax=Rhodocista pekingensis TaxID=201185 RepID=A0ABW2L1X7_9PROT